MPQCEKCRGEINPNTGFCQSCGAPYNLCIPQATVSLQTSAVQRPSVPTSPPQPTFQPPMFGTHAENVFGVLLLRKPKSLGRYDTYTGIVTSQRIIFAQMTSEMLKGAIQTARDQAKAEGKGFWGQWEEQLKASFGYAQRYLRMDPNMALAETPGNYAVNNDGLREIKLKLKPINRGQETHLHEFEIEIASNAGNFEFKMDQNDDYVEFLKQVFGEKVKLPFGYLGSVNIRI